MENEYSYYSVDEFVNRLSKMSDLDMKKIMFYCEKLRLNYDLSCEGEDLFQESLTRVLSGQRNIPREVPIVVSFRKVISSVADSFLKSKVEVLSRKSSSLNDEENPHIEYESSLVASEILNEEEISKLKYQKVLDFFKDDEEVLKLIRLLAEGVKASEIKKLHFDGDDNKYNAIYKRYMRRRGKLQKKVESL